MKYLKGISQRQRDWLLVVAILLFGALTRPIIFYLIPDGQMNDDACFLLRGLHFARADEVSGFAIPTHYAAGWPVLLALFLKFSQDWYGIGRVVSTCLTCLTACLLGLEFVRRSGSRFYGLAVALLFLNAPQVMILGSSLMSEPLYFLLLVLCLFGAKRVEGPKSALLLGLLAGWCFLTRTEGLLAAAAVGVALVTRQATRKLTGLYLGGFLLSGVLAGTVLAHAERNPHLMVAGGVFGEDRFQGLWSYGKVLVSQNATMALEALFNRSVWSYQVLWLLPLIGLFSFFRTRAPKAAFRDFLEEPIAIWLAAFPFVFFLWPFFNPRYWPLWAVLVFSLSLKNLAPRTRGVGIIFLLILQLPGAWHWYQMGPLARRFQNEIYLPFYRGLGSESVRKVMTLNNARVSTIARVPASDPIMSSDFQSLPIAMAHMGCDVIEWETTRRTLRSATGSDARLYPPDALEGLRKSSLFKLERRCDFAECFRLMADPEKLKQAGTNYSFAMQTQDPNQRREFLEKAAVLVADLPEVELALWQSRLAEHPEDEEARGHLEALLNRYPFLQREASPGGNGGK